MAVFFDIDLADPVSRLRFALGDTDTTEPLFQDETYEAILAANNNIEAQAIVVLAEALLTRFAQLPDSVKMGDDGPTLTWKNRVKALESLLARQEENVAVVVGATGFNVQRPNRYGYEQGSEYRCDSRPPW